MRCKVGRLPRNMLLFTHFNVWLDIEEAVQNWIIFNHNKHRVFGVSWSAAFSFSESLIHWMHVSSYPSPTWEFLLEASFFTIYFIVFMVSWIAIRTLRVFASRCSPFPENASEDAFGFGIFAPFVPVLAKSFQMTARNIAGANFGGAFPMIKQW